MMPEEIVKDTESRSKLATYDGPGKIITSWDKLDEIHGEKKTTPTVVFKTMIPSLDEHIRDCRGGQLIIPSGDEGEGKTLFARTLTNNFSEQEARCLWFSYEERPDEFLAKFGDNVPLFLLPAELEMNRISWIAERIKEAKLKYKTVDAVFIDHLHYLTDEVETGNLSNDLGRVCRKLKLLAVNENIIVVLIVHTNRSEASDEPTIRSLRDSGMIGKEADTVIFIWRLDGGDDAVLKVAKCRATGAKKGKERGYSEREFVSAKTISILEKVIAGEMATRDAAYRFAILGLPLPEVIKIELSKQEAEPNEPESPLTPEQLEEKFQQTLKDVDVQRKTFIPERQAEVAQLKEEMKNIESFGETQDKAGA